MAHPPTLRTLCHVQTPTWRPCILESYARISEPACIISVPLQSTLEIYNEQLKDLLAQPRGSVPGSSSKQRTAGSRAGKEAETDTGGAGAVGQEKTLRILEDPENGGTWVEGLTEEGISSADHLASLLATVEASRKVGVC